MNSSRMAVIVRAFQRYKNLPVFVEYMLRAFERKPETVMVASHCVHNEAVHHNGNRGGGTVLDAIATATPVVTLAGPTLRSSQTRALFERMGVRDGIATDGADYVRRAVDMATRSDLRADMAQRIRRSSGLLFEDVGMVREVEALFRQWVAQSPR